MIFSLNLLFIIVSSLISVAFFTSLERKFLSYIQSRKGPNKVSFLGILQPFSDALKLFSKSVIFLENSNFSFMFISPFLTLSLMMLLWPIIPSSKYGLSDFKFSILIFFVISSISVYSLILIGWSANSKYCYLGSIRSLAQLISYEVSLFLILISISLMCFSYNIINFKHLQTTTPFLFISLPLFLMWMTSCLAESNRSPFDFAEGESELVSGFNVEYSGGTFALIFLAEYLSMIMLSILSSFIFFNNNLFMIIISMILLNLTLIWIRGTFPRFRYDLLMMLNWKVFLPLSISLMIWFFVFSKLSYFNLQN